MTLHVPVFLQPSGGDPDLTYSGQELRNWIRALLAKDTGFQGERGIFGGTGGLGFAVAPRGAGANFSVDIATGRSAIIDTDVTNGGTAVCWNDATYNLATPSPPGSGADLHRVVLQLRNKLENGSYSTYDFVPSIVVDSTHASTLPAEPNSAVTIGAVAISHTDSSVQVGNITDYREQCGAVTAYKTSNTTRTSNTSMSADPALQLTNLAANAIYQLTGTIFYNGPGSFNTTDGIKFSWNATGCSLLYHAQHYNLSGGYAQPIQNLDTDTITAGNDGVLPGGNGVCIDIFGTIDTGNAPCSLLFKWAQAASNSTGLTVMPGSILRAVRQG